VSRFQITDLPLAGLKLIERKPIGDHRGFLSRIFCAEELQSAGWDLPTAQINHTYTAKKGTVRGLHFQHSSYAEKKLVNCLRGDIWDVVVDLRQNSLTFLKWHAEYLSAENHRALLIPEGFAHGFQVMTDDVEMLYLHSAIYHAEAEDGLNVADPTLSINWPLSITEQSERDKNHPMITEQFTGISLP
jgi:dTDP-4-dehydrorhamnose 3,5-epimerase